MMAVCLPRRGISIGAALVSLSALLVGAGCGLDNPYRKREPRCKVGCDGNGDEGQSGQEADAQAGSGLYLRAGVELPLDAAFWLNQTPLEALSDGELQQVLFANPVVIAGPTDPSFSQETSSLESVFAHIQTRSEIAAAVTDEQLQNNPSARCFRDAFGLAGSASPDRVVTFMLHPGRCFTLDQVSESLSADGEVPERRVARLYEDSFQLTVPSRQGDRELGADAGAESAFSLIRLSDDSHDGAGFGLPLVSRSENTLQNFSIQMIQIQGTEGRTGSDKYSVTWDYLAAGQDPKDIFSISFDSETQSWTLRGTLVQATGVTQDPEGLRLGDARSGMGYARIVTFDDFRVSGVVHLRDGFERSTGSESVVLSGSYRVDVPQPASAGGTIGLSFHGLDQGCIVEARSDQSPEVSLGRIDICTTPRAP
jgi:hypothetical protein